MSRLAVSLARWPGLTALSSMLSYTPCRLPNFEISASAVFSPMPGTPGMLSDESPIRLFTSMSWGGSMPYFSRMAAGSMGMVSLLVASRTVVASSTSCRLSRSPVASSVVPPAASQAAASVPKISSASQPALLTCTKPRSVSSSFRTGICWASSSGMPWRVAL